LDAQLLADFPKFRVGFLEGGVDWAPRLVKAPGSKKRSKIDRRLAERVFISSAFDDDLSDVAGKLGDAFRQGQPAHGLKARGDLNGQTMEKILSKNPLRLYNIA
jgi:hypothetical protein